MSKITKEEVQQIVTDMVSQKLESVATTNYLPKEPSKKDLLPFLRGKFSTKRLRKKFLASPDRYAKSVIHAVWKEWEIKRWSGLGRVLGEQLYSILDRESSLVNSLWQRL